MIRAEFIPWLSCAVPSPEYSAHDIEVLEGLEPVRRRPGMYVGGTDEAALHHLAAEVLDNAMDEAVAGHASRIEVTLEGDGTLVIRDNGRGIPVDDHPRFPGKSALEVILTTLHSGGKFSGKAYKTSGGLHGVGLSVVNALSSHLSIAVVRNGTCFRQAYSRGALIEPLTPEPADGAERGTTVRFQPDADIFGTAARFQPFRLYRMVRSKAYLYRGVHIRWECDADLLEAGESTPTKSALHFPNGLRDFLDSALHGRATVTPTAFVGEAGMPGDSGRVEWAITWPVDEEGFVHSYCNTIPTPQGGTHEAGLRNALTKGLKGYGDLLGSRRAGQVSGDDVLGDAAVLLSVFLREPQFQGQTKEKLASSEATRLVEQAVKDRFDLWLSSDPAASGILLERLIEKAEERARRKQAKELQRKTATRKLRLPGKLADCARSTADGTEIFLVEGDSAGGSAKQARNRDTQAILPLRGKILNVASATSEKMRGNQELSDLVQALGCGTGRDFSSDKLRYEKVIIMTDADVDGAHIASLLMTFFYREIPGLIQHGHLYLALPPLYRLSAGGKSLYARDDEHKDQLMKTTFKGKKTVEISRFKGLGEMPSAQLKETTMDPAKRSLLRVVTPDPKDPDLRADIEHTDSLVQKLMGRKPELRFRFIQENARFVREELDV